MTSGSLQLRIALYLWSFVERESLMDDERRIEEWKSDILSGGFLTLNSLVSSAATLRQSTRWALFTFQLVQEVQIQYLSGRVWLLSGLVFYSFGSLLFFFPFAVFIHLLLLGPHELGVQVQFMKSMNCECEIYYNFNIKNEKGIDGFNLKCTFKVIKKRFILNERRRKCKYIKH